MIQAKCIEKFRDKQNKIVGYRLIDLNQSIQDVTADELKQAIRSNQIHVINLSLTSDNRLIDTSEKQLDSIKIGKSIQEMYTKLAKALVFIDDILISLGDDYPDTIHNLCEITRIEYDTSKESRKYVQEKAFQAYKILLQTNPDEIFKNNIEYYVISYPILANKVVEYTEENKPNPVIQSIELLSEYAKFIVELNRYNIEYPKLKDSITNLKNELLKYNSKSCALAYRIGHTYARYLNTEFFGITSNDGYTVGGAQTETDDEYSLGEYTIHAKLAHKDAHDAVMTVAFKKLNTEGVTIAFFISSNKFAEKYHKMCANLNFKTISFNNLDVTKKSKSIADILNHFAEGYYGNNTVSLD